VTSLLQKLALSIFFQMPIILNSIIYNIFYGAFGVSGIEILKPSISKIK